MSDEYKIMDLDARVHENACINDPYRTRLYKCTIREYAELESGCHVGCGSVVGPEALICYMAIVGRCVSIGQWADIGEHSCVHDGSIVCQKVKIAPFSQIPPNSCITQDTLCVVGSVFTTTLLETGIVIGCEFRTPEDWMSMTEDNIEAMSVGHGEFLENIHAVVALWYSFFEWK